MNIDDTIQSMRTEYMDHRTQLHPGWVPFQVILPLRPKRDRRSVIRPREGLLKLCPRCGDLFEFRELHPAFAVRLDEPLWLCVNQRCGWLERVRAEQRVPASRSSSRPAAATSANARGSHHGEGRGCVTPADDRDVLAFQRDSRAGKLFEFISEARREVTERRK